MKNENFGSGKTSTIKRLLDAPIDLVWEAWTDPKQIIQWWNPRGSDTKIVAHDFKEGGHWKYSMMMPNGQEFITEGVYKEIIFHQKIISSADFKPMTVGVEIQAYFEEMGEKTGFTFNIIHESESYRLQQEKMGIYNGWGSVFDRLNEFLTEL